MRVVGAGLSKTGTTSLHEALQILGMTSLHFDQQRLNDVLSGDDTDPDFARYDDVDAVTDLPTAWFFEELLDAYPDAVAVLTVRDADDWWGSVNKHFNGRERIARSSLLLHPVARRLSRDPFPGASRRRRDAMRIDLRRQVYGSTRATEYLYKKRYRDHNERVRTTVDPERLLVMDVASGDGWPQLCGFLGLDVPDRPFPHSNAASG